MHTISVHPILLNIKLKDLESNIDPNTVVEGDFNTPFSWIESLSRQRNFRTKWHNRSNQHEMFAKCLTMKDNIHSSQQLMEPSPK
jgi:hypothetical protein